MKSDNWVDRLISEYKEGRNDLYRIKNNLGDSEYDLLDKTQINSMINDMSFVIKWLETGKNPEEMRGVNIRNVYRLRYLENMDMLPDIQEEFKREQLVLSSEQKRIIMQIFATLSDRERDCFVLHTSQNMSMSEIADELNISKATVQVYIQRAKEKIERIIKKAS